MTSTGVIVTGGGSGIGRASALALAAAGRPVAAWDLDGSKAAAVAEEVITRYGVDAIGIAIDVRDTGEFRSAIDASRGALGTLGGLVHAAGTAGVSPIDVLDGAVWEATISVHLSAAALLLRDLAGDFAANDGSAAVLISSIEGIVAHAAIPAYCSAKAGMLGLTRSAAAQLGAKGIRVNAICPGFIETPLFSPAVATPEALAVYETRIPLGRLGRAEEIAAVVRFLLSEEASYLTGAEIVVDGGVSHTVF